MVFSGDFGAKDTPILCDPDVPEGCDLLILESTYGDRLHGDRRDRVGRLGEILDRALTDDGKVLIPAFALGRTQELIYEMDRWFAGAEDGDHPIDFKGLYAVRNHSDHLKLCDMAGPAVILAGSGMCSGGRIVNHLQGCIEDERNDVLFVGYQVKGTPGRDIMRYPKRASGYVMIEGEKLNIRAKVHVLTGYSAHADQKGLVERVGGMSEVGRIKLVHGEVRAQEALEKNFCKL